MEKSTGSQLSVRSTARSTARSTMTVDPDHLSEAGYIRWQMQMQNTLIKSALRNPSVQVLVQSDETRPLRCQLQNVQILNQLHDPEQTCFHR